MDRKNSGPTGGRIMRIACLVAAAISLAGCIVVPAGGPHWHPYYYR